jgi:hypothetical protein
MTAMLHSRNRRVRSSEEGYLLVWVMFMLAVFTIWLSVAIPRAAKEIQRDREVETMQRGKQYVRAVQLYYKKFRAFPPNADALNNTNQIRFLRKKYIDPITRKDDWKPIRFGQAKTQTLGFFGQPIAGAGSAGGSVMGGIGPGGNGGLGGSPMGGSALGGSSTSSGFGGSSIFSSSGSTGTPPTSGIPPGSGTQSPTPGTGSGTANGTTGTSTANGTNGSSSSTGGSTGSSSDSGSTNQTFGGAGIIGFAPPATSASILIYKKKQHYNEWEFIYDPLLDMRTQGGNTGMIGQPASGTSTPIGGSSGFGSSPGFGSGSNPNPNRGTFNNPGSGTTPPPQSPPQQ